MDKIKISQMTMEDLEGVYEIDKEAFFVIIDCYEAAKAR